MLTDVYFVDQFDKKIAMRLKNDQRDKRGRHIIADHIWINLTKPWLETGTELLYGDEVFFKADVKPYKRVRKDTLAIREQIYQKAKADCERIYDKFSFDLEDGYDYDFQKHLKQVKEKQKRIMKEALEKQAQIKLMDYTFKHVGKIKIVKYRPVHYKTERQHYNAQRYNDGRYIKYLIWHSKSYASHYLKGLTKN